MTTELDVALRVLLAALLGGVLGLEREWASKAAGLRTNMLVATGAAAFTAIGALAFGQADGARVAAQVVTGIGFLGAGTIFRRGNDAVGLTTAATIWVTAAIGMACGVGWFLLGAAIAAIGWVTLVGVERLERMIRQRRSDDLR